MLSYVQQYLIHVYAQHDISSSTLYHRHVKFRMMVHLSFLQRMLCQH